MAEAMKLAVRGRTPWRICRERIPRKLYAKTRAARWKALVGR